MPRKTGGKKLSPQAAEKLREALLEREKEILNRRLNIEASWTNLHEREIEFEEMAQKEVLAQGMEQLDDQERKEVQAIDRALRKLDTGLYGNCETCGRNISVKRLEAIPWTQYCNECAGGVERGLKPGALEEAAAPTALPAEYQGLSDEEIERAIWEELKEDGRVEIQELEISCENEIIYLEGALPSEEKHHILLEIIEDAMGFQDVIDRIEIDRQLWERRDRAEGRRTGRPAKEELLEGEEVEEDVYESRRMGSPMSPPDHLTPEKEE